MDARSLAEYEIKREFPPDFAEPRFEVADIFRAYGADYRSKHQLSGPQFAAMEAIEKCRTTALGGHVEKCDHCGHVEISYNSCRNRNCPKCRGSQRSAWVDARELELLPIQYFHIVFTLPDTLLPLARYNPEAIYALLFQTAAETLQTFAGNRWDGKLGIIMVLHTWGQTLNDHPHVHCIVTGGVLKNDASAFVRAPKNFLFPVTALSPVFRAKFIDALQAVKDKGKLNLRGQSELATDAGWQRFLAKLRTHAWVVYAKHPFAEPGHLIRYLGRYVNRIAIANHRIRSIEEGWITFTYLDYREKEEPMEKTMRLSAEEFIRRFLAHIPPPKFRRVRYYGFLVNSQRKEKLILCRTLLALANPEQPYIPDPDAFLAHQRIDYSSVRSAPKRRCAASTPSCPTTARRRNEAPSHPEMQSFPAAPGLGDSPLRPWLQHRPKTPSTPPGNGALARRTARGHQKNPLPRRFPPPIVR